MIRNTINEDPRKIKRQKFFAKYGISIAIGGCALVAGIVSLATNGQIAPKANVEENQYSLDNTELQEVPEYEYIENAPTAIPVPEILAEPMATNAPDNSESDAGEQISTESTNASIKQSTSEIPDLVIPVNGEIIREYAKEKLVYSSTLKEYSTHLAIDIAGEIGRSVVASADGEVILCGNDKLLGQYVVIKHTDNVTTGYYSLGSYNVSTGDKLKAGDVLGTVGNTAILESNMGEHVHFELTYNDVSVDPTEHFITK